MSLASRLVALESAGRAHGSEDVNVYWGDALTDCTVHPHCGVEQATGRHITGVIRLTWGDSKPSGRN